MSEEALQIGEKRREAKGKGERERDIQVNAEFQRIARRDEYKQRTTKEKIIHILEDTYSSKVKRG